MNCLKKKIEKKRLVNLYIVVKKNRLMCQVGVQFRGRLQGRLPPYFYIYLKEAGLV